MECNLGQGFLVIGDGVYFLVFCEDWEFLVYICFRYRNLVFELVFFQVQIYVSLMGERFLVELKLVEIFLYEN